jgi:hypothetical protein
VNLSRRRLLQRATAAVAGLAVARLGWVEQAFAARSATVQQTIGALVSFVAPDRKVQRAAAPLLIRTLDRFLPGPQPLSATAAAILDGGAAQVKPGATFAQLTRAEKARVFETLERLPVDAAGSIRFLVGNLPGLAAFVAYSTPPGRRLARYMGRASHGHKDFKGYWRA